MISDTTILYMSTTGEKICNVCHANVFVRLLLCDTVQEISVQEISVQEISAERKYSVVKLSIAFN